MREIRLSGSEGGGANPIVSPYPYLEERESAFCSRERETPRRKAVASGRELFKGFLPFRSSTVSLLKKD